MESAAWWSLSRDRNPSLSWANLGTSGTSIAEFAPGESDAAFSAYQSLEQLLGPSRLFDWFEVDKAYAPSVLAWLYEHCTCTVQSIDCTNP